MFAASPIWKGMPADLFKEAPEVEVLNTAITVDVVTRSALAQTDQPQSIRVSTGVFLSSAQIGKIIESNLRKPSKIVPGDACE